MTATEPSQTVGLQPAEADPPSSSPAGFPVKPLGIKAYGSIPHLPGSRLGPGDHTVSPGQDRICTVRARDRHDVIHVQEKLDGSCCSVAKKDGQVLPLGRAGYLAASSSYEQHRLFADWVFSNYDRFDELLSEGERVVGKWLAQAHGIRYDLPHEPFVAFDLMIGTVRMPMDPFRDRVTRLGFTIPFVLHSGGPVAVADLAIEPSHHGALDPVEGVVYRVERRGIVDFLAKWVRHDKIDGCYLPELSERDAVWNWRPDRA